MKISSTGKNLDLVISTKQSLHHEWMTFACWYSINKNLPDAKVSVIFPRANENYLFGMLNRCHVPYTAYKEDSIKINQKSMLLEPNIMCIRELSADTLECMKIGDCSEEEPLSFVNYSKCGNFDIEKWFKEKKPPFSMAKKFKTEIKTTNEQKVFALWEQMGSTYDFIHRPG